MASRFRDFSRSTIRGGGGGGGRLGGGSTSTTNDTAIEVEATGLMDFFKNREQDKVDRAFIKKNAEKFGFTPDEIDTFSREDLRSLKSDLLKESVEAGREGQATQTFLDLMNQVEDDGGGGELKALFGEGAQPTPEQPIRERRSESDSSFINETLIDQLGAKPNFPVEGVSEEDFDQKGFVEMLSGINPTTIDQDPLIPTPDESERGLRPSVPIGSVQPRDFGTFVDSNTSPSDRPLQQIQDALIQMNPRDAARVQNDPIFTGMMEMAKRKPQAGQLVQDEKGQMWSVSFDKKGNVKNEEKLNIKKAPSSLKNTTKILQVQRKDGSLGMDAVTFDNSGKLIRQIPVPGAVPKSLKIDVGGLSKGAKTKVQGRMIELGKNINETKKLRKALGFDRKTGDKLVSREVLTGLGRIKAGIREVVDRVGALDPDLPLGNAIAKIEKATGIKMTQEARNDLARDRNIENLSGKIVTAFQKDMTGVAGPPETFERLESISVSFRKLGPVGMDVASRLLLNLQQDEMELLKNVFLASNKEEFINAFSEKIDTRLDALEIEVQNSPQLSSAFSSGSIDGRQKFERKSAIRGEGKEVGEGEIPSGLRELLKQIQ